MASNLTQIVVVERETPDLGIDSDEEQVWAPHGPMRAEVRPLRFTEAEREGATRIVQGYLLRVYTAHVEASALTASDRLLWKGLTLNIREVRQQPSNVRFTEIVAEAGITQ